MSVDSKRGTTHRVHVSYLEIYQERVADLLKRSNSTTLKVREHPKKGPYVQGLTTCLVTNYGDIQECMNRYVNCLTKLKDIIRLSQVNSSSILTSESIKL